MANKETILKVIKKEIFEEPQPSEELRYQTYTVKEEVLDKDCTVDDGGQEILTEPKSTEQPETCLVKEEGLADGWTEDSDRGQVILTEPKSIEQPETCLVKEEELEDGWTENDITLKVSVEPQLSEKYETSFVKEENLDKGWAEDHEPKEMCEQSQMGGVHKGHQTDCLKEDESIGDSSEDNGATEVCQEAQSEGAVRRRLKDEDDWAEDDNAKEMNTHPLEDAGYQIYYIKQETVDNDRAEDDKSNLERMQQSSRKQGGSMQNSAQITRSTQQMPGDTERHLIGYFPSHPEIGTQSELSGRETVMGRNTSLNINHSSMKSTPQISSVGLDHLGHFPLQSEIGTRSDSSGRASTTSRNTSLNINQSSVKSTLQISSVGVDHLGHFPLQSEIGTRSDSSGRESTTSEYCFGNITNHAMNGQECSVAEQETPESGSFHDKNRRMITVWERECEEMRVMTSTEDIGRSTQYATIENNISQPTKTSKEQEPFQCSVCKEVFSHEGNLKTHIQTHTGEPHQCTLCDMTFPDKHSLLKHMKTHTGEKMAYTYMYQCSICMMEFSGEAGLKQHIKTHDADEKPYGCSVCKKKCLTRSGLALHSCIGTKKREEMNQCSICNKWFTLKGNLKVHLRTHTGEKPYRCFICSKGFNQNSTLVGHMRTHTGEKPYQCSVCSRGFSQSPTLKKHMRIHTGEKPFECFVTKGLPGITFLNYI